MAFIDVHGERIYYTCSHPDSNRNLVLIHGSGGDHSHWPAALRETQEVGVYALDLPGHGQSKGRGRDRVDDYAEVIAHFVAELGLSNVFLVGHSLGGAIVQTLGLRAPGWLAGLILVGTGCRLRVAPAILEGLLKDFDKSVELICDWAFGPAAWDGLIETGKKVFLHCDPRVMHMDFSACNRFDLTERVSCLKLPTLIVSGSEDKLTPLKYGRFLNKQIHGSRLVEIQGGGHMLALEKPDEFTKTVFQFTCPELI